MGHPIHQTQILIIYELEPETLESGREIQVVVYSLQPITVRSGKLGSYEIRFPK